MPKEIEKQRRKRVLIVCQHFWPENFRINDIATYLSEEKNCDVDVLCGLPNYPRGKLFDGYSLFKNRRQQYNGISIERVPEIPRGNNSNFRIFVNYLSFPFFSLFYIPKYLFRRYDKILIYQLSPVMMSIFGIILGKIKRTQTTMYVLDLWPENLFSVLKVRSKFLKRIATSLSHWHYRRVDKLVALSKKMRDQLLAVTGKQPSSVTILPQTSEKIYETSIRDDKLAKKFKGTFNIVFAGNISPAQSFETILEAAVLLKDSGVKDVSWIIVGDGMSKKWLESEVKARDLGDFFYFEGQKPIEDMPRYTYIADIFVGCLVKSQLLEATIPAKVMSYMASGKPSALAMDGEVKELINKRSRSGYVTSTQDSKALYGSIRKLYDMSNAERSAIGNRGKKYYIKHFERDVILGKLHNFLFDIR